MRLIGYTLYIVSLRFIQKRFQALRAIVRTTKTPLRAGSLLLLAGALAYAGYMNNTLRPVNPHTYTSLLAVIGAAESNNNYNAYYGNAGNSTIIFTNMSLAEVLQWQQSFIQQGNASSAVGRYQIINTTLASLVQQLGIDDQQKFTPQLQDTLAIALLERRGAIEYANKKITSAELAASLAKEWAALPQTLGATPEASYYAGDGLNAARVTIPEVLGAINLIRVR